MNTCFTQEPAQQCDLRFEVFPYLEGVVVRCVSFWQLELERGDPLLHPEHPRERRGRHPPAVQGGPLVRVLSKKRGTGLTSQLHEPRWRQGAVPWQTPELLEGWRAPIDVRRVSRPRVTRWDPPPRRRHCIRLPPPTSPLGRHVLRILRIDFFWRNPAWIVLEPQTETFDAIGDDVGSLRAFREAVSVDSVPRARQEGRSRHHRHHRNHLELSSIHHHKRQTQRRRYVQGEKEGGRSCDPA